MRQKIGKNRNAPESAYDPAASFVSDAREAPSPAVVSPSAEQMQHASDFGHSFEHINVSAGQPLNAPLQADMEGAFGTSFARVRVHETPEAQQIGAAAFTQGEHIHFRPGRFAPATGAGRQLLAHELTHVVQQRAGRVSAAGDDRLPINIDPGLEAEADQMSANVSARPSTPFVQPFLHSASPVAATAAPIQMETEDEVRARAAYLWREKGRPNQSEEDANRDYHIAREQIQREEAQRTNEQAELIWNRKGSPDQPKDAQDADYQQAVRERQAFANRDAEARAEATWIAKGSPLNQTKEAAEQDWKKAEAQQQFDRVNQYAVGTELQASAVWQEKGRPQGQSVEQMQQDAAEGRLRVVTGRDRAPTHDASGNTLAQSGEFTQDAAVPGGAPRPAPTHQPAPVTASANGKITDARKQQPLVNTGTTLDQHLIDSGRATPGGTATWTRDAHTNLPEITTTGGPNLAVREEKSQTVVRSVERAINQNKAVDKQINGASKTPDEIALLYQPYEAVGGVPQDPVAVATAQGVSSNFAHFAGRHGAPEANATNTPLQQQQAKDAARAEQLARIVANVNPDEKASAKVAVAPPTIIAVQDPADATKTLTIPNYTTSGDDNTGKSSGGFASHQAQLFAIEEGLSQSWDRVGTEQHSKVPSVNANVSYNEEQTTKKGGTKKTKNAGSTNVTLDPTRHAVDVTLPAPGGTTADPLFAEGFGESFSNLTTQKSGIAISPGSMRGRAAATTSTANEQGANVIIDRDTTRGGFSVQTAYPQVPGAPPTSATTSNVTLSQYTGTAPGTVHKDVGGNVTGTDTKFASQNANVVLPPSVGGAEDSAQLQDSLNRIQTQGETVTYKKDALGNYEYEVDALGNPVLDTSGKPKLKLERKKF